MNYFVYNNKPSSDFGCEVSDVSSWNSSFPAFDTAQVPGVLGDLVHYKDTYTNINITYRCMWKDGNFEEGYDQLRQHLMSAPGYHKLWDSYHSGEYRNGVIASQLQPQRLGYPMSNGVVDVTFYCKPQRYLSNANGSEIGYAFSSVDSFYNMTLINTTGRVSKPYLYFQTGYLKAESYNYSAGEFEYDASRPTSGPSGRSEGFIDCELGVVRSVKTVVEWRPTGTASVKYPDAIDIYSTKNCLTWGDSLALFELHGKGLEQQVNIRIKGKGNIRPRWWTI